MIKQVQVTLTYYVLVIVIFYDADGHSFHFFDHITYQKKIYFRFTMDISSELGGHLFMINDPKKKKSILLGRTCVQKLLDNKSKYGNMIHKCLKGSDKYWTELFPLHVEDHIYIMISRYEGQVRVDLRTFAPKEDNSI